MSQANHSSRGYGPEIFAAHYFGFFNAISYTIILSTPLILYARQIGASSSVLGIIASLMPLLTALQIPAAHFLGRFGYKNFIVYGWTARTFFTFCVAALPLAAFLDNSARLVLLVVFMACFNFIRGIASSAWMPWVSHIVPAGCRGVFFSRDAFAGNLGSLVALLGSALVLSGEARNAEYSLLFFLSAVFGLLCVRYVKKMPEVGASESLRASSHPVPWVAMLRYGPFFQLVVFSCAVMFFLGALGVFSIEYLSAVAGLATDKIILITAPHFVGAILFTPLMGSLADRVGSRPVQFFSLGLFSAVLLTWVALSGGLLQVHWTIVAVLSLATGYAGAAFHVANSRLGSLIMPEMGRNHFFAMFTVITCVCQGVSPVVWGLLLDGIGDWSLPLGAFVWKRHSLFFAGMFVVCIFSLLLLARCKKLSEKCATSETGKKIF